MYERHIRMTAYGTLPGGEIFTFGLALGRNFGLPALTDALEPNDAVWNDLRDDLELFWSQVALSDRATLMGVKFAPIGEDGRYTGPPVEKSTTNVLGIPGINSLYKYPNQVALAVTTHAAEDLGRIKGRFYLPLPSMSVESDGRITEQFRDSVENRAKEFIDNINNQPGLDVLDIRAVVASQGRKNADGSVKFGPRNFEIRQVSVGRTLDTIRRRRNKVGELRGTPTAVAAAS